MQLIPCPFCGLRGEAEFHFGGDLGNARPEGGANVDASAWADYLYLRNNRRGETAEIWMHITCGEIFRLDRDTVNHQIAGAAFLDGGHER